MTETVYLIDQKTYKIDEIKAKILNFLGQENLDIADKTIYLKPSFVFPTLEKIQVIANPALVP